MQTRREDVYLPHHERLKLPILLFSGGENVVFKPEANQTTLAWLTQHSGPKGYKSLEVPNYEHIDGFMGRSAVEDVFPPLLAHLEETA